MIVSQKAVQQLSGKTRLSLATFLSICIEVFIKTVFFSKPHVRYSGVATLFGVEKPNFQSGEDVGKSVFALLSTHLH